MHLHMQRQYLGVLRDGCVTTRTVICPAMPFGHIDKVLLPICKHMQVQKQYVAVLPDAHTTAKTVVLIIL